MAAEPRALPPPLAANWDILTDQEKNIANILLDIDQGHLFAVWPPAGTDDAKKKKFLAQAIDLNNQYPQGVKHYVENAKKLLQDSLAGVNPYAGWKPSVPHGERLSTGSAAFHEFEKLGMEQAPHSAFVLVAGGLGERLGYNGIKLALPAEITTEKTFLQFYIESIQALQTRARSSSGNGALFLPLVIMTSDDTHARTVELLREHNDFGLAPGQIAILKQEKVPAVADNAAHFVLSPADPYEILTKPHGHGDVHTLLFQSGKASQWAAEGRKWIVFFQDTNGLGFHAIPAAIGVSAKNNFEVNSLTVSRKPGEAVGAICRLTHDDGRVMIVNVEYNQLDPLLRSTVDPRGDLPDDTGFSPYPGNINVLIFAAGPYAQVLSKTHGHVPEFVNPKYADATKTKFTSPARLECMMQDYPKLLGPDSKVGFSQFDRWTSFSAVKNNIKDAIDKYKKTGAAESASWGESDLYYWARRALVTNEERKFHIEVDGQEQIFADLPVKVGARIVLSPSFGVTLHEIHHKFRTAPKISMIVLRPIVISSKSTLILDGEDIFIDNLDLDGALVIHAVPGAKVRVVNLRVHNAGWSFTPIDINDKSIDEKYRIRGYVLTKHAQRQFSFGQPGDYTINEP